MIPTSIRSFKNILKLSSNLKYLRIAAPKSIVSLNRFTFSSPAGQPSSENVASQQSKVGGIDGSDISDEQAIELIKKWVTENKVCLFMKGDPKEPRCGFSNFVVQTLKFYKIKEYKSVDILKYEAIRKQAKIYSNWPTFPQLFVNGKLIGGSDIVSEMHKDGSLKELFLKAKLIE